MINHVLFHTINEKYLPIIGFCLFTLAGITSLMVHFILGILLSRFSCEFENIRVSSSFSLFQILKTHVQVNVKTV